MRRVIVGLVSLCGLLMVLGAGFMIVDKAIDQDRRDNARAAIEDTLDQYEDTRGKGRAGRLMRRAVEGMRGLGRGMLFKTGVDLAQVLPNADDGWSVRAYDAADAQRITGQPHAPSSIYQNATQSVLARFAAAQDSGTDLLRVYEGAEGLIAIRLELSKPDMRALDRARPNEVAALMTPEARDRGGKFLMSVDGVDIRGEPSLSQDINGQPHKADYLHLRFALGRVMRGEVIATAPPQDVLALVQRLNMAEVWNALPQEARAGRGQNASIVVSAPQD